MRRHEVVRELLGLLNTSRRLKTALRDALRAADRPTISKIKHFCDYVDRLVQMPPNASALLVGLDLAFYYIIDQSEALKADPRFRGWMVSVAKAWGEYLDSPRSIRFLDSFVDDPSYRVGDYQRGPSGWLSFNQFFARRLKPGLRPVDDPQDEALIVSPVDGTLMDQAPIDARSEVVVKGVKMSIARLLGEHSAYARRFAGGWFCHALLEANDYHRYHAPTQGRVVEARNIPGDVWLKVVEEQGELKAVMEPGFQVRQDRGLVVIESRGGLVGVLPVGMGHISSVVVSAVVGTDLFKGEEIGYFQFGGSDVVLLIEGDVTFEAAPGDALRQGRALARRPVR